MAHALTIALALGAHPAGAAPLSILDPGGPSAGAIATLWWVMLAGGTALFVLTMACAAFAWLRRRRESPGGHGRANGLGADGSASRWIVWGGLVLPGVVLPPLLAYALLVGERLLPRGDAPFRVEAEARRWSWTFRYPDEPGWAPTIDRLRIPVGRPVEVRVTSGDVIHSFWIPRLGGKIDAIPGHANLIRLRADAPGTYRGTCSEYCGEGHAGMGFVAEAVEEGTGGGRP